MKFIRPVTRVMPLATIKHKRLLPVSGRVVVNQGQAVKTLETVAEAHVQPRYRLINVAQALDVPREEADGYITCQAGEVVHENDVVAEKGGLLRKVVHSPVDGEVLLVGDGQILLREYRPPWELKAGVPGKVTAVYTDRGVEITTLGAVLDGIWGNGKIGYGLLKVLGESGKDSITPEMLSIELRGLVLAGGRLDNPRVLALAEEVSTRALIVGSMHASMIPAAMKASFPVVVLDSFGEGGMSAQAFRLLSTSENRNAAVLGEPADIYEGTRPVVVMPLSTIEQTPETPPAAPLQPGTQVRILRAPYQGAVARVISLPEGLTRFPNGVRAPAVEVRLENGERAVVPAANVEVFIQSSRSEPN